MNVFGVEPPYLLALTGSKSEFNEYVDRIRIANPGLVLRTFNGKKMKDWPSAMDEIALKLEFPAYFGKNIPALSECLQDLEWLPGESYLIVLYDVISVLSKETHADVIIFFKLLDRICREWGMGTLPGTNWERKQTPFHVLLCGDLSEIAKFTKSLQSEIVNVPILTASGVEAIG